MRALERLGYTNVKEYKGGKKEWLAKGFPVESTKPANLWQWFQDWVS